MSLTAVPAPTPGVSAQALALTFRELATMLRAGMPLDQALAAAAPGQARLSRVLDHLSRHVSSGKLLSEAVRAHRALFHPVVPAILAAGEATGNLDTSCELLAQSFEFEAELKRTIHNALVYPFIVIGVAILAVGLLAYIGFMPPTWATRLLWLVGGLVGLWLALRFRVMQLLARYVLMFLPFFGTIMQQLAVSRFCHTFGLLTQAGVPYLEGLEAAEPVVQHPIVDRAVRFIYAGVRNGCPVEQCIRSQAVFPPVVHNLVAAGETAGSIDDALLKAADYLWQDAKYRIKGAAQFAGPVATILIAIIVLLILVTFWTGYFDKILSLLDE